MDFPFVFVTGPRVEDKGSLFVLTKFCIPSDPFSLLLSLFIRTYFLDTLTPLCYLHYKKSGNLLWALPLQGPISTCL
jgi:hypothetical protein